LLPRWIFSFFNRFLGLLRLRLRQEHQRQLPPFVVFRIEPMAQIPDFIFLITNAELRRFEPDAKLSVFN